MPSSEYSKQAQSTTDKVICVKGGSRTQKTRMGISNSMASNNVKSSLLPNGEYRDDSMARGKSPYIPG